MKEKTALEWFFDNIKDHLDYDKDLYESVVLTYSIAKLKEKKQLQEAMRAGQQIQKAI